MLFAAGHQCCLLHGIHAACCMQHHIQHAMQYSMQYDMQYAKQYDMHHKQQIHFQ
jgi:hypothetical protein